MAGGIAMPTANVIEGGFLTGRKLIVPLSLVISLFFLWGFSYGLLDVLNSHFRTALNITPLQSTGLQVVYFGLGYFAFSPVAAEVLKRKGYKLTILMGLSLYSLGAIFFWPTAHFSNPQNGSAAFGGFVACTAVIACGLASLEVAANSYATVIGDPATASARLQFCQSWNGVASFIGPLIASKFFFTGENATSLTNVQFVYLAVACAGVLVAILFAVTKLPEVSEAALAATSEEAFAIDDLGNEIGQGPFWKQYNMIFAFIAQFMYVGAQVTIGAFFIFYVEKAGDYDAPTAANMLSYALITFTVGRFIAFALALVFQADFLLAAFAVLAVVFNVVVIACGGTAGAGVLIALFFFMAPMYPTIFALGTANLGRHTRRGAGLLVMGVGGGAVFPPIQGAIYTANETAQGARISYLVPLVGFVYVLGYATFHWFTHGKHVMRVKDIVSTAAGTGGAVGGAVVNVAYDGDKAIEKDNVHLEQRNL